MLKKICIVLICFISAISCSKYEKLLKSDNYPLKYKKAMEYYGEEEYVKAGHLFEQLMPVYKGTAKIDTISYYHAQCKLNQSEYLLASHYFKKHHDSYPNSPFARDALFLNAFCFYKASPRPSLDQTNTRKAIEQFHMFNNKYPDHPKVKESSEYIREMRNKLVYKSYKSAKLYYDLQNYKAAIIALNNSLEEYPDTKYREDILYLIVKSHFLLAENSVIEKQTKRYQATIDAYYSYVEEFNKGQHFNEVQKIYDKAQNYLN